VARTLAGETGMTVAVMCVMGFATGAAGAPGPLWVEGEHYYAQRGSTGPDRPPFASRGQCLGSNWGRRRGHFVAYRFRLDRQIAQAMLTIRYARKTVGDARFDVMVDGKRCGQQLAMPSTGGWGHLRQDEWRYKAVPLGLLSDGWHELRLVSARADNNTNIDGFFIAGASFKAPEARKAIEAYDQPVVRAGPDVPTADFVDEELTMKDFVGRLEDWYTPDCEPAERAGLKIPALVEPSATDARLAPADGGDATRVSIGEAVHGWRVAETLTEPEPMVVLEREFAAWGLIVYVGKRGIVAEVRKAVGRLEGMTEPAARFPKDYFDALIADKTDALAEKVLGAGRDPTYEDVVGYLAPCHTYTFLGSPTSVPSYVVQPDGCIGLLPNRWGGDKLLAKTLLDPRAALSLPEPAVAKRGLLGNHLPAIDYGFVAEDGQAGWELCALQDVDEAVSVHVRVRRTGGQTTHYQLDSSGPTARQDGKAFFAALLRLDQYWDRLFGAGMQVQIPDRRSIDVARASIARALSGYARLHPKYGVGGYWADQHDGFPPTTLSLCACLLDWGLAEAAGQRLGYYLANFVRQDGTLDYYGPAVAEYGQLLDLIATYVRRTDDATWFARHRDAIDRLVGYVHGLRTQAAQAQPGDAISHGLIRGSAEADTRKHKDYFFSGNVWAWRGLLECGKLFVELGERNDDAGLVGRGKALLAECERFRADILRAADRSIVSSGPERFLPPTVGFDKPFASMTQDRFASYTNYRYWLETLSARCLTERHERLIVTYRTSHGGELLGMTRFQSHLDDWPYWHHARAMLAHDLVTRYLLGYHAHIAHHQTRGTFTAYEQVPIRGYGHRREVADYCVPAQLTAPFMLRWMLVWEERDEDTLWLCRAIPRSWLTRPISFSETLTRWGRVGFELQPAVDLREMTARITLSGRRRPTVMLRVRHPKRLRVTRCDVVGGRCVRIDPDGEVVRLTPEGQTVSAHLAFQPVAPCR